MFGWMTPGEVRHFPLAQREDALVWAAGWAAAPKSSSDEDDSARHRNDRFGECGSSSHSRSWHGYISGMNDGEDGEPDDGLWFVLAECEYEIYRDAPGLATTFDRWECRVEVAPGGPSRADLLRRLVGSGSRHQTIVTAPPRLLGDWHDTRTVLP